MHASVVYKSVCRVASTYLIAIIAWILAACVFPTSAALAATCTGGDVPKQALVVGEQPALVVSGPCTVPPGNYFYGVVNVIKNGSLTFKEVGDDSKTNFWASSIIVEAGGAILAGVDNDAPYGKRGGTLTILLYGADQSNGDPAANAGHGATCVTKMDPDPGKPDNYAAIGPCGVPWQIWNDNGVNLIPKERMPGGAASDYFYQYGSLYGDGKAGPNGIGYFGYKSLGVSFDGTLRLRGWKGTSQASTADLTPTNSGSSWMRLANGNNLEEKATSLTLERSVAGDWTADDRIAITTTDYLPSHSEERVITGIPGTNVQFTVPLEFPHNGTRYPLKTRLGTAAARLGIDPTLVNEGVETRAAVALLNRSIRIVSAGDKANETFDAALARAKAGGKTYYFGGHTVFRQGFRAVQLQGVEFNRLGQGGRLGHYPVHFHMARSVPPNTYIKDSSVNESMTRWYVLHSTSGVLLARNVGYKSIGHGFYLETGTETDNKLYSNIGIFARAAIYGATNPLSVPGILAANNLGAGDDIRYTSDVKKPTVFWIMNGWNDFTGNMAAGAGACGACYWLLPGRNSDHTDVGHKKMKWTGYAASQEAMAGGAPLKSFYRNYCTSAMNSFTTVGDMAACLGFAPPPAAGAGPNDTTQLTPVRSVAPDTTADPMYYPMIEAQRNPAKCDPIGSCTSDNGVPKVKTCTSTDPSECVVTVLDHYTTSFNWGDYNFASVWLRSKWYLFDNGAVTDQLSGGLTFISGGDYTRSSAPEGYWALASRSLFIGETQPTGKYTPAKGPLNNGRSGKTCTGRSDACVNIDLGVSYQLVNFGTSQRLFNIYDGPAYQDANAYLDITTTSCSKGADCMYATRTPGVRRDATKPTGEQGYMPNAAIGWKQPNGFYYPPAFRSSRLFFDNVNIRHYLVEPLLKANTYITNYPEVQKHYVNEVPPPQDVMGNFTDVDRQTELTDNDGTLTGLVRKNVQTPALLETISVNKDPFFNAPIETDQCRSNLNVGPGAACTGTTPTRATAKTSPYEYLTTVVYPSCADGDGRTDCGSYDDLKPAVCTTQPRDPAKPELGNFDRCTLSPGRGGDWSKNCGGPFCFGVPIYRQYLIGVDNRDNPSGEWLDWKNAGCYDTPDDPKCRFPLARMAGMSLYQRSVMTVNNGTYYIDTTVSKKEQQRSEFAGLYSNLEARYLECNDLRPKGFCEPHSVNVFQGGRSYYVFFVYARASTRQVYQMYVGDDFIPKRHFKIKRVPLDAYPFKPVDANLTPTQAGWIVKLIPGLDGKQNILEVTVNFQNFADSLNPRKPGNGTCKPDDFCTWNGSSCGCSLDAKTDPRVLANPRLLTTCQSVCTNWAVKDLDCPKNGCIGFEVILPARFVADDRNRRPKPGVFPNWNTTFGRTSIAPDSVAPPSAKAASSCFYPKIPGTDCPVPRVP